MSNVHLVQLPHGIYSMCWNSTRFSVLIGEWCNGHIFLERGGKYYSDSTATPDIAVAPGAGPFNLPDHSLCNPGDTAPRRNATITKRAHHLQQALCPHTPLQIPLAIASEHRPSPKQVGPSTLLQLPNQLTFPGCETCADIFNDATSKTEEEANSASDWMPALP